MTSMTREDMPVRTKPLGYEWPGAYFIGEEELELVGEVVQARLLFRYYGLDCRHMCDRFEKEFAAYVGSPHAGRQQWHGRAERGHVRTGRRTGTGNACCPATFGSARSPPWFSGCDPRALRNRRFVRHRPRGHGAKDHAANHRRRCRSHERSRQQHRSDLRRRDGTSFGLWRTVHRHVAVRHKASDWEHSAPSAFSASNTTRP